MTIKTNIKAERTTATRSCGTRSRSTAPGSFWRNVGGTVHENQKPEGLIIWGETGQVPAEADRSYSNSGGILSGRDRHVLPIPDRSERLNQTAMGRPVFLLAISGLVGALALVHHQPGHRVCLYGIGPPRS
jgi:hypothetical protein